MQLTPTKSALPFLQGGGEMGELTRQYDWASTSLGPPDTWPLSLRTTVGIVLHSAFPMFLFWGNELTCFYNDAYRPSLGTTGKHPALGKRAQEVWPEIWDFMGPLIDQVMATGEPVWFEDQLVPIHRNGRLEDVYWTFSYSPTYGDDGQIGGMLVTCNETTGKVNTLSKLQASEQRFQNLVREASVGIIVLSGEDLVVDVVNETYMQLVDRSREDLLGKPLFNVIPEAETAFRPILDNVRTNGEPLYLYSQPYFVYVNGAKKEGFLDLVYQPYREQDGTITGVIVLCQDVTEQVQAQRALTESEAHLDLLRNTVPAMIFYLDTEQRYRSYNDTFRQWFGVQADEAIGKTVREFLGEKAYQNALPHLSAAYEGQQERYETRGPARLVEERWLDIVYTPHLTEEGKVLGVIVHASDITQSKKAELAVRESEVRFRTMVEQAPVAITLTRGNDVVIETINAPMLHIMGKEKHEEVIGKKMVDVLPEIEDQAVLALVKNVLATGDPFNGNEVPVTLNIEGDFQQHFFDISYTPLVEDGNITGVVHLAIDVTEQVLARRKVEESENNLRSLVENAPFPIGVYVGREMRIQLANQAILDIWGKGNNVIGKLYADILPELENQAIFDQLDGVYTTGIPFKAQNQRIDLIVDGKLSPYYFNYNFTPLYDANGEIYGVMNTGANITDLALAKQQVEEAEATLRGAIEMAELGTWHIDLITRTLDYSERLRRWFGIGNDEIITPERAYQPVRAEDRPRVQAAIARAIAPGSDGIYDIEYAVDDAKTGRERILHIQGRAFVDENGKAYKLSGTAQDVTQQRHLERELERQVQERTEEIEAVNEELAATNEELAASNEEYATINEEMELTTQELTESNQLLLRSNENLQRFAYVASHDLQEPLRKIQQFGDLLKTDYGDRSEEELLYLDRMQSAASRMSVLIRDLLNFSRISTQRDTNGWVPLTQVVQTVLTDLDLVIEETQAQVTVGTLPTVMGDTMQLGQLFSNLLSNALKFRRPDVTPLIDIRARLVAAGQLPDSVKPTRPASSYHLIEVSDNGIGFEEKYLDRIFQVFQRLHGKSAFAGTGIGLAICEKVVTNHGGAITASSQLNQGATFSIYLPR